MGKYIAFLVRWLLTSLGLWIVMRSFVLWKYVLQDLVLQREIVV